VIYTYPARHPTVTSAAISVDSSRPFDLVQATHILDLSRRGGDVVVAYGGTDWWTHPEVGKLFDFLGYRGADILHVVGEFTTPHSAYLSLRLEKLYDESTLDEWAQA
jgi:hypothetical protein